MTFLSFNNINKVYPGNVQAVFDFNLDVKEVEFIVLVGPSGCGKSTVLRMLAGLEEITSGRLLLEDRLINDLAPSERNVAMVFQDYALYGNLTVYQNIGFSLAIRGYPSEQVHRRVMTVSDTVQLNEYLNRFPKALSGGQRQRVAMGRSIAKHNKILLMDEPLSNLDAKLRQQTRIELAQLHYSFKPTIVYVTHDQVEAMTLADRIVVMNEGYIQQIGSPYEVYHKPANLFTASFIGMQPINLIKGQIKEEKFTAFNKDNNQVFELNVPKTIIDQSSGGVTMGIRPENIRLLRPRERVNEDQCMIDAPVTTLELLGAEYYAGFNIGGVNLYSRIPSYEEIKKGGNYKIIFNISQVHFFDGKTGLRLEGLG